MSAQSEKKELEKLLSRGKAIIIPNAKGTTDLWTQRYFGLLQKLPETNGDENVDVKNFAACFKCKAVLSYTGTTTHLQKHKDSCTGKVQSAVSQTMPADRFVYRKPTPAAQAKVRQACAAYVSIDSHSFNSVEGEGKTLL